jgi:hypothetical protein
MANRMRRQNQPSQTKLRLELHRTDHPHRGPNLVGHGVFAHNLVKISTLAA